MTRRRVPVGACLALCIACGRSPDAPIQAAAASSSSPAPSLVRVPRDGGEAKVYALPGLAEEPWEAADRLPPIDTAIGFSSDQGLVFLRDTKGSLLALDLPARRVRLYTRGARTGAVGADGTLYVVDTAGGVQRYARRSPERLSARLRPLPGRLHAVPGNGVLGIDERRGLLSIVGDGDSVEVREIASGPAAVSPWGDLMAVAADTAVVVYDPTGRQGPRWLRFRAGARALAFSPSGHQLYVAQDDGQVAIVDRFGLDVLRRIELPGRARALRAGPLGRWLLAQAEAGDTVWVVDLQSETSAGTLATGWAADLPLLTTPDGVVLREGADVVTRDLVADGFPVRGRIEGGAGAIWLVPGWQFAGAKREPPAEDVVVTPRDTVPADSAAPQPERVFLQLSSSRNPDWARELADTSRYCLPDVLGQEAWTRFGDVTPGYGRVQAICDYVHNHLQFAYGSSTARTTAADVHESRYGVCRDFTHLAVSLCRALNIPARYVFGYLPEIEVEKLVVPMDFAAWMEVWLGNRWFTFDPRNNRPRKGRVLIGRGRDAADVAMLTTFGAPYLQSMSVIAEEAAIVS